MRLETEVVADVVQVSITEIEETVAVQDVSDTSDKEKAGIEEKIRERAYQLFAERGFEHGHDLEDWARAESEIMAEQAGK